MQSRQPERRRENEKKRRRDESDMLPEDFLVSAVRVRRSVKCHYFVCCVFFEQSVQMHGVISSGAEVHIRSTTRKRNRQYFLTDFD